MDAANNLATSLVRMVEMLYEQYTAHLRSSVSHSVPFNEEDVKLWTRFYPQLQRDQIDFLQCL